MTETASDPHPLDSVDQWECYDQHISERNKLISAKREAEDGFVNTIIQLSTAIVLAVPGLMALNKEGLREPTGLLISGIVLVSVALLAALCEQFLSSIAYEKQIEKTDAYYKKESSDVTAPKTSKYVKLCLALAFISFLAGISVVSIAFLISPWRDPVAQTPTPRPTPTPNPDHRPTPKHDTPGRSVPPTPPPTPPTGPRR